MRIILVIALGVIFLIRILMSHKANAKPENQAKDAEKQAQFEKMLEPGERLIVVCPESMFRKNYWGITDRRLLIETNSGFSDVRRDEIKKVACTDKFGNKCKNPNSVMMVTVTADKKYYIQDGAEAFQAVVRELMPK